MHSKRFQLISDNRGWFVKPTLMLSTVELPISYPRQYESMLFNMQAVGSDIVATYDSFEQAVAGHHALTRKYGLH